MKILIIDDEADVVTYLAAFFKDNGFDVVTAFSGHEGFQRAAEEKPDLITLDITMPHETGIHVFAEFHSDPRTKQIPIIIITGTPGDFPQLKGEADKSASCAGYFEKPINRQALLQKVRDVLKMNQANPIRKRG